MQASTRNQFSGTISAVAHGPVNAEVDIDIGNGLTLVSIITNSSSERLGLEAGKSVTALIKASSVILTVGSDYHISARNQFCGKVVSCQEGAVNGEVSIELPGGMVITSIITNESIHKLGISEGSEVCALVKAFNVIVAVPA